MPRIIALGSPRCANRASGGSRPWPGMQVIVSIDETTAPGGSAGASKTGNSPDRSLEVRR